MASQRYLRDIPARGMGFVIGKAKTAGFVPGSPTWVNLGQGQPEVGDIPGGPARITSVSLEAEDQAYGPINGGPDLRTAVAEHYNRLYRQGKSSQYTAANVAIVAGGRPALNRVISALDDINIGYTLPDYTAYEDLLGANMSHITPIPVRTLPENGFRFSPDDLPAMVRNTGINALLMSNPCNPTGAVLSGHELSALLEKANESNCALLLDEFYSQFIYVPDGSSNDYVAADSPVSAAAYVRDVDTDNVVIFDGLTKNFRYPGWRLGWVVAPRHVIDTIEKIGIALDGGPSNIVQRAALTALDPAYADHETSATRAHFTSKRNLTVNALRDMGITTAAPTQGTCYVWGCLEQLPAGLSDATEFFRAGLENEVITVPGQFFDINPGRRRDEESYRSWTRFSFGPPAPMLNEGLNRLAQMIEKHR